MDPNGVRYEDLLGAVTGPERADCAPPSADPPDHEAQSTVGEGFAVYSRQRLLAVADGSLSAADYSRELARHVNARLACNDDTGPGTLA
jgi:hypothetical protein